MVVEVADVVTTYNPSGTRCSASIWSKNKDRVAEWLEWQRKNFDVAFVVSKGPRIGCVRDGFGLGVIYASDL